VRESWGKIVRSSSNKYQATRSRDGLDRKVTGDEARVAEKEMEWWVWWWRRERIPFRRNGVKVEGLDWIVIGKAVIYIC
jgi:hypothetical protein